MVLLAVGASRAGVKGRGLPTTEVPYLPHAAVLDIDGCRAHIVAVFGIDVTIVEPGGATIEFLLGSLQLASPMPSYDNSPAAFVRGVAALDPTRPSVGDPAKIAARIAASADQHPAPRRLVLGSDSYEFIQAGLVERLAEVELQAQAAGSTDWTQPA
jgi:hypothetical protein